MPRRLSPLSRQPRAPPPPVRAALLRPSQAAPPSSAMAGAEAPPPLPPDLLRRPWRRAQGLSVAGWWRSRASTSLAGGGAQGCGVSVGVDVPASWPSQGGPSWHSSSVPLRRKPGAQVVLSSLLPCSPPPYFTTAAPNGAVGGAATHFLGRFFLALLRSAPLRSAPFCWTVAELVAATTAVVPSQQEEKKDKLDKQEDGKN